MMENRLIIFQGNIVDEFGDSLEGAHVYFLDYPSFNGVPFGIVTDNIGAFHISDVNIHLTSKVKITYVGKEEIIDVVSNLNNKTIVMKDAYGNLPGYTGTYKKKRCWICIILLALGFGYSVYKK